MSNELELVSKTGERHGLINQVANSCPDVGFKYCKPQVKEQLEKKRKDESRLVKARYLNSRGPTERLTKPYCHYAGDPIQTWHFIPGEVYTLPKGLVDEVNDPDKRMPQRSEILDAQGRPTVKDGYHAPLHQFVPVEF